MPKTQPATAGLSPAIDNDNEQPVERRSTTKWEIFEQANLVPTQITCQAYFPVHRADSSCHSRMCLNTEAILRHLQPGHESGGALQMVFKQTDGKPWPGWKGLAEAGAELHDFRCDNCDAEIQLTPRAILRHMKPHNGKSRRVVDSKAFNMTVRFGPPDQEIDGDE